MRLLLVFHQLWDFNSSGSNQDSDCSQFTLSGWRLEVVRPLIIAPCAPAMQQSHELKNERSGGVWEKGFRERGEGDSKEDRGSGKWRGKKENMLRSLQNVCWNNGQQSTLWQTGLQEGFCPSDGHFVPLWKALTLRVFAEYILHGTIYQHKTATKQAWRDNISSYHWKLSFKSHHNLV